MSTSEAYLDQLIAIQYRAVRYYLLFAVGLVVLGIVVMTAAYLWSPWLIPTIPDAFKGLFGIGGAFVSSLSTLQVKEILSRKERIEAFETFKARMRTADEAECKRIEELVWEITKKIALG